MSRAESPSSSNNSKILTYRWDGQMVYVKAAPTFELAADRARQSYADLADVQSERISFYVTASVKKDESTRVRISPSAWTLITSGLPDYEILDIQIADSDSNDAVDAPPQYETSTSSDAHEWDTSKIVTYRHGNELVFVKVAPTVEAAADLARETYKDLAHIPSESILFYVSVRVREAPGRVCISSSAWSDVTPTLPRCEIMDVEIARPRSREPSPSIKPRLLAEDVPPCYDGLGSGSQYLDVKDARGRPTDPAPQRPRSPGLMDRTKNFFSSRKP
ncbi:uncharacterized protein PHACADRAFT_259868 [Phanerochaete carnosa HHB-10118-sp]|uniref:Uncharacterized protein n=1 Tax=Phanerochaete carnosa (strain HHB-10118-sp) TaxID=650164 RepID=K5WSS2_PHACS|nr:uncharacterized protein PHACADRAFT_259868 [Phanerochaete carnosa HHB-10118-sp]EKM53462.1 hypothetical protein PHACADRAFT_259868 [Phanerochaete carnosa HHB-10118-sp]